MAGVLVHDGRRSGHMGWCVNAVSDAVADGVIISAFSTPRVGVPRHPSAELVAHQVAEVGGEVVFDAETHARFVPGANKFDHYDTWELWGPSGIGFDTPVRRLQHVERVFAQQDSLGSPRFAPTLLLETPDSQEARDALLAAEVAQGLSPGAWQALVGSRAFWRSGYRLDEYVGSLAALGANCWVITVANEFVQDQFPDLSDLEAFSGLLRTIHSLSERSRVILAKSDWSGLLGVAAGADTIGAGWDRAMRTFDPNTYHVSSDDSPRIPASYVTQAALSAVMRRDTSQVIERMDPAYARRIRGGDMPPSDQAERSHHLRSLRAAVLPINVAANRQARVEALRNRYDDARGYFDDLINRLSGFVRAADRTTWLDQQYAVLEHYARAEGLW